MPRALAVVDDSADVVLAALRSAFDGGPAVLPLARGARSAREMKAVPSSVSSRVALVVQSSGTTGTPKRVALSAEALLASAAGSAQTLGGKGQWLLALPAHYIAGINVLVRSIEAGTEPVVMPSGHFDPLAFVDAAAQLHHPMRFTSLVPAQLAALIAADEALESLRSFSRILVGGQSMPQRLLEQALELGLNITRSYGSSETSGGCVYDGIPFAGVTMRIVDGEVELGGPTLADGYVGDDKRTAAQFYTDATGRWYRTSDAGSITVDASTPEGILRVTGRLDDVIISGGVNVSLSAVERVVTSLEGLESAVVVSRPDEHWGEVPVVVSTTSASLEYIRAAVERVLGAQARPASIIVVDSIPLLPSGKPDRNAFNSL